jgi:hypothetical protein
MPSSEIPTVYWIAAREDREETPAERHGMKHASSINRES